MELNQLRRSVQEIARVVGAIVEEKLGDRTHLEEQFRNLARTIERSVSEAIQSRMGSKERVELKLKALPHFSGELPHYQTSGSSGMDVRACLSGPVTINPMERKLVPTGLSMEVPKGFEVQVRPRSGLAIKKGLSVINTPGTIDADYRGEVQIILINLGQEPITIENHERIAQMVICPVVHAEVVVVDELAESARGNGGFGSTGV